MNASADISTNPIRLPDGSPRLPSASTVNLPIGHTPERGPIRWVQTDPLHTASAALAYLTLGFTPPASTELSAETKETLGPVAVARLDLFRQYRRDWNGAGALPLSRQSIASLDSFVKMQRRFSTAPSVFLNDQGNLVLAWENGNGQSIEAEFTPDRLVVYFEDDDEKLYVPITPYSLELLAQRLT